MALSAWQGHVGGAEASLDGRDELLRDRSQRRGPCLVAAAAGPERHAAGRAEWRGVAAEQAGVGDVLDVSHPGAERSGVVPGLGDGGADHVSGRRPAPASNGTAPRAARSAVRRSRLAVTDRTASALDPAVYSIGPSTTAQSGATSCRASARTDSNGLPPLFIAHLNRPTPCVDRGEHVSRGGQDGTSVRPVREPDPANSRTSSN